MGWKDRNMDAVLKSDLDFPGVIEPRSSIGHLIRRAQQLHGRFWSEEFNGDLTSPQYAVLVAVAQWPGIDQTRAGELASLDKSSGADVINRLAEMAWILRVGGAVDRRKRILRLSAPARAALKDITPRVKDVQRRLLSCFTAEEAAAFVRLMARVAYRSKSDVALEPDEPDAEVIHIATAPGHLLRRSLQVHTSLWSTFVGDELTGSQYAVLATLIRHGDMDQTRLGELASLDKSVVGDVVTRLGRKGWLLKDRDPADGRRRILRANDAGYEVVRAANEGVAAVQNAILAPLTAGDSELIVRLLAAIPDAAVARTN